MGKYALVDSSGHCVNVVVWDGNTSTWAPESGQTAVGLGTTSPPVGVGWTYSSGTWVIPGQISYDYWEDLRKKRDTKLQASDWKVTPGSPYESKLDEWKTYRQQLRDLPANTSDPQNITWPTRPS